MPEIATIKHKLINLVMTGSSALSRWIKGVLVILEKLVGDLNAQKLQAILLLEADFNAMYKIILNNRLIPSLEATEAIPIEVIGRRRS